MYDRSHSSTSLFQETETNDEDERASRNEEKKYERKTVIAKSSYFVNILFFWISTNTTSLADSSILPIGNMQETKIHAEQLRQSSLNTRVRTHAPRKLKS